MAQTFFQSRGLNLLYSSPIVVDPTAVPVNLTDHLVSWQHTINMDGGFDSAAFEIEASLRIVEEWLEFGLGRHFVGYSAGYGIVWEGFLNQIVANVGTISVTRGPLMNIANRVSVTYTPYIDVSAAEPTTGTASITTIAENEESQAKYGILEDVVSGGTLMDDATYCGTGCTPTNEAEELRDAYLEENKLPETSQEFSISQATVPTLTLECLGYHHWLNKYVYDPAASGTVQIPTKLKAILAADPNAIFSTNYNNIADAAAYLLLVPAAEEQIRFAKAIIDEMVAMGDANDNRTFFAIYEDREAHYSAIPTEVEYYHYVTRQPTQISNIDNNPVMPWQVRPGKWMTMPDFLPGFKGPAELRFDPRNVLIESVTYQSPLELTLNGKKVSKVSQLLAKRG